MRLRNHGRGAFTLVEILVIIAIIAVIISLVAAGTFQVMDTVRHGNTESTMRTVNEVFKRHYNKVVADADQEWKTRGASPTAQWLAGGDSERAKVIWRYFRLMEAFPQSYAEIQNPVVYNTPQGWPGPPIPPSYQPKYMPTYQKQLGNRTSNDPLTEGAACLFLALSQDRGGRLKENDVSMDDTDQDGMKEITDGWGKAIVFFRFPTANADLQQWYQSTASSIQAKTIGNPLDPLGRLLATDWYGSTLRPQFEGFIHPISGDNGSTSYYTLPVLVSAATNGNFGFDPTSNDVNHTEGGGAAPQANTMAVDPNSANASNDNIYSYRLR
jgi:type II secretory pathway pseudopilin PulG